MKSRIALIIVALFMPIGRNCSLAQDSLSTSIIIDSIGNEVQLIVDKDNKPLEYFSAIFTPVCVDGSCYPIHINLHWNLAGKYVKYTLPKDEILTKVEHLPFSDFDYGLLHRMIAKYPSALSNFTIYELTIPTKESEPTVDGTTGATRPELSGSFVPDALFTTYTLWHLARKPSKQILSFTRDKYFHELQEHLISHPELGCQIELISDMLSNSQHSSKTASFFEITSNYPHYFPPEAFELITLNEFKEQDVRLDLIQLYQQNERAEIKLEILGVWAQIGVNIKELESITAGLGKCSSCFATELHLIDNFENWPESQYFLFYEKISSQRNMIRRSSMEKVLSKRQEFFPKSFKKHLKKSNK